MVCLAMSIAPGQRSTCVSSDLFYGYMDVSENSGTTKSSILIGFSIINHPFWGTPIFGNTHMETSNQFTPGNFTHGSSPLRVEGSPLESPDWQWSPPEAKNQVETHRSMQPQSIRKDLYTNLRPRWPVTVLLGRRQGYSCWDGVFRGVSQASLDGCTNIKFKET